MKFSMLFASGVFAFVVVVGVQAYGNNNQHNLNNGYNNNNHNLNNGPRYSDNGCGYDCRNSLTTYNPYPQSGARSAYGPYHSYAVRPAIYGGHGMYHYRGYARHPLPPANAHYRRVRSPYASNGGNSHYGMRPVKALVLAPAYSGSSGLGHYSGNNGNRGARQTYGAHRAQRGYGSGAGAGAGRHYRSVNQGQRHYNGGSNGLASSHRYNYRGHRAINQQHGSSRNHHGAGGY